MPSKGQCFLPFCLLCTLQAVEVNAKTPIANFANNTGLSGLMTDEDDYHCRQQISDFVDLCDENCLQVSVERTKEMIIDFREREKKIKESLVGLKLKEKLMKE